MKINEKEYTLPEQWTELGENGESVLKELQKEISKNHLLYNKKCIPLAKRLDQDDVLFSIPDINKFAVVHLTWGDKEELDPMYPITTVYESVDDFLRLEIKGGN